METKIQRTDEKIRRPFVILDRRDRVLMRGHIYEQRKVMLTERAGEAVSEQYSTFDAVLQMMPTDRFLMVMFGGNRN